MKYGLIGRSLVHSVSPAIHELLGNGEYELCPLEASELDTFMKKQDFHGINVTIPYKQSVIPHCHVLSPSAKQIGSVNTVVNKKGILYGYNTDYDGFLHMAKCADISFLEKRVLVLGSGGTSLTACAAISDSGGTPIVVSRGGVVNYENMYDLPCDIIVNTTPVGMYPNTYVSPVELSRFNNLCGVLDVVYNPLHTQLLQQANMLGIPFSGGLMMLVAQAAAAHNLFFGQMPSLSKINRAFRITAAGMHNIILVGMPGSGKSTLGKMIAKKLDRPFFDSDALIAQKAGMSIPEIFEKDGECSFRSLEENVICELCTQAGAVIATGGGSVLSAKSRSAMLQNGYIVYIDRRLKSLSTSGRPLSKDFLALTALFEARNPIYEKLCTTRLFHNMGKSRGRDKIVSNFKKHFGVK